MIGDIAAITSHMRVGSAGDAADHAPIWSPALQGVAALFRRIDLGSAVRRAPSITRYPFRCRRTAPGDDFLERFQELLLLERGGTGGHPDPPRDPRAGRRRAAADLAARFERLQRSSTRSSAWVFLSPIVAVTMRQARCSPSQPFKPTAALKEPYAILGTTVIGPPTPRPSASRRAPTCTMCAAPKAISPLASPRKPERLRLCLANRERLARQRARLVVGGGKLRPSPGAQRTDAADELMITTMVLTTWRASATRRTKALALVPAT